VTAEPESVPDERRAEPPTLWEIVTAFATIGLTSIGGAGAPFRHVLVVQRRWVTEGAMAELYGLGQALPGSVIVNISVLLNRRLGGVLHAIVAVIAMIVPSMLIAIAVSGIATQLSSANARFAAAEVGVTAALAGVFVSNGVRVLTQLWSTTPDVKLIWRSARMAIGALGVVLVVGLRVMLPITMVVLVVLSLFVEWRLRVAEHAA
jgi:chromate transporter